MRRLRYLPLVVLGVLLPLIVSAEMYQWVDDKGVRHYSNSPPAEGIKASSSWAEITTDEKTARAKKAQEADLIKEVEASNRQSEIEAKAAKQEKARQEVLDAKKAEKAALGESIVKKRRYIKRRGKTELNKIKRLAGEIEALKKDKNADPEKIKKLEAEMQETKEKIYKKSGRARKGAKEEIERYRQLDEGIQEDKK